MSYQIDIDAAILANEPLASAIFKSEALGHGFFWDIADGSMTVPYIVAQTISDQGTGDLSGVRDMEFPLIQFSCWAATKQAAVALTRLLKTAIEGQNLPGDSNTSLGYAGTLSNFDPETGLYAELIEYRASSTIS